jgi:L-methionine (R)-S-oxide reductase
MDVCSRGQFWLALGMQSSAISTQEIKSQVSAAAETSTNTEQLLTKVVEVLHAKLVKYNWVGFYMLNPAGDMLHLGPFMGAMTPHTSIPLNQGICGAAASTGKTVIVDDVNSDARYLACSTETKSEIVVPVFAHGKVVGELDIDSHFKAAFTQEDRQLCEFCAQVVGQYIEKHPA